MWHRYALFVAQLILLHILPSIHLPLLLFSQTTNMINFESMWGLLHNDIFMGVRVSERTSCSDPPDESIDLFSIALFPFWSFFCQQLNKIEEIMTLACMKTSEHDVQYFATVYRSMFVSQWNRLSLMINTNVRLHELKPAKAERLTLIWDDYWWRKKSRQYKEWRHWSD